MRASKPLLLTAGLLSIAVALFQAVITFSPSWSKYFGAPEELVANPPLLYAAGSVAAVIFGIFGLYALSGAGWIRPFPLLRPGLLGIGILYTLRGSLAVPLLLMMMGLVRFSGTFPSSMPASSLVSLLIGVLYLAGTISGWTKLAAAAGNKAP
jgi:hypothetical protein